MIEPDVTMVPADIRADARRKLESLNHPAYLDEGLDHAIASGQTTSDNIVRSASIYITTSAFIDLLFSECSEARPLSECSEDRRIRRSRNRG